MKFSIIMKHISIYSLFVLAMYACGHTHAPNEIVLDYFATTIKEINVSDIASHIDYIQLETTQASLISNIDKIQTKDGKMYILDIRSSSLLVFDLSGKFIRKIGNKGNGPGEYVMITDFALRDSVILAMDAMQMKMMLYDSLGRLIAEKHLPNNPPRVAFYKDIPACEYNFPDFAYNDGFRISIYDRSLNPATNLLKSSYAIGETAARNINATHFRSFFAKVNDTLTFWESRDDIVYKIIDDNNIVEKYKIQYSNKAKFEEGVVEIREKRRNQMDRMMETHNYIFFTGSYDNDYCRLVYSKKNREGVNVGEGFKTNGGPDFFPYGVTEDNKAYQSFSVYAYKTELEEKNISTDKLDPKLQSLVRTCNFDDNPCVMLVTLK